MSSIHTLQEILWLKNNLNVILADDDPDDRELFEEAITELNSEIYFYAKEDGIELMNHLNDDENQVPDVLFLDMNMPRKNGKKCLEEIRNNPKYKQLSVIIYSTSSNPRDIMEAYNMGANLYIHKPNSYTELLAILKIIFSLNWEEYRPKTLKNKFILNPGRYKLMLND